MCLSTPGGQMGKIEFSSYLECPLLLTLWMFFVILLILGSFRLIFAPRAVSGTLHTFKPQKWNLCGKFPFVKFFVFLWNTFLDPVEPFLCKITSFPSWRDLAIFAILGDFSRFWALSEHFERYFPQTKLVLGCISGAFVHVWGRNMLIREFLKGFWGIARPWIWGFSAKIRFLGSFLLPGPPQVP